MSVPLTAGAAVFDGAVTPEPTVDVCGEVAGVDPAELVAVTTDRIVWPVSPDLSVYLLLVAPLMVEQLAPEVLQSSHL